MSSMRKAAIGIAITGVLAMVSLLAYQGAAAQTPSKKYANRVYIELSEDFYQSLKAENGKRYSTDNSDEYLRQIAVSSRFMVETNLQILNRQEQIIKLLEQQNKKP